MAHRTLWSQCADFLSAFTGSQQKNTQLKEGDTPRFRPDLRPGSLPSHTRSGSHFGGAHGRSTLNKRRTQETWTWLSTAVLQEDLKHLVDSAGNRAFFEVMIQMREDDYICGIYIGHDFISIYIYIYLQCSVIEPFL